MSTKLKQQQLINPVEFKEEFVNGKIRVIISIVGYCMLIIGSAGIGIYMGKLNISADSLKRIAAFALVIIWSLFLIAESIKLYDLTHI
jgi:uncharacterized membrane protein